jgi:hypothetical protein
MPSGRLYSIRKYLLMIVFSLSIAVIVGVLILNLLGLDNQGILVILLISFPGLFFIGLYGFYKGLIHHYDFKGDEKLFWGGKF